MSYLSNQSLGAGWCLHPPRGAFLDSGCCSHKDHDLTFPVHCSALLAESSGLESITLITSTLLSVNNGALTGREDASSGGHTNIVEARKDDSAILSRSCQYSSRRVRLLFCQSSAHRSRGTCVDPPAEYYRRITNPRLPLRMREDSDDGDPASPMAFQLPRVDPGTYVG